MGFFSFNQEIAIDLGTANTIILYNDKIVVDAPSMVALDNRTGKLKAVGHEAQAMYGRAPENIRVIRPLQNGVIADFNAAEQMMRGMMKMVSMRNTLFSSSLRMVVCIPSGSTEVEIRAVRDSSEHVGGRDVYMIYEPMAAAIGVGIDVEAPDKSIRVAGDEFNEDIREYMGRQYNIKLGERTAELIKINVGSALNELENPPEDYIVHGPNRMTSLPMELPVTYQDVAHCIEKSISKIEAAVLSALDTTPPELYADIVRNGIYLTGGGALLRGLDKRLTDKIGIAFHVAEDPLLAVARGTGIALKNVDKFSFLMR